MALGLARRAAEGEVDVDEMFGQMLQRAEVGQLLLGAGAEEQHQLATLELARAAQPAPPLRHGAHGCAAGAGADHHDMALRVIRHQETGAEGADHLRRVTNLQVAQVVASHAAHRLAVMVFQHPLDRQRRVVVTRPLAVAGAGHGVLAGSVNAAGGVRSRRQHADRLALEQGEWQAAEVQHDVVRVVIVPDRRDARIAGDHRGDGLLGRFRPVQVAVGVGCRPRRQGGAERGGAEAGRRSRRNARLRRAHRRGRNIEKRARLGHRLAQQLGGQFVPAELLGHGIGLEHRHHAPVVDRAGGARRDAGHAGVALGDIHHVVAIVVGDRAHRAGGLAGVAADADLGVDQVLPDDAVGRQRRSHLGGGHQLKRT